MEELKLVLESMEALGEDGKEAFAWWLIAKYGSAIATSISTAAGFIVLLKVAGKTIHDCVTKTGEYESRRKLFDTLLPNSTAWKVRSWTQIEDELRRNRESS